MPRTKKQIKQLILKSLLSGSDIINKNAIARKSGVGYQSVCRYIDKVYKKFINKKTLDK